MSTIPPIFSRVPNLLQSQVALSSLSRTQVSLYRVQQQLSTGLAVSRFSDDPVKAATISVLNDRLSRAEQHLRNLDHADSSLSVLDLALGDAADLVLEAKSIASAQVGVGSTAAERRGQAEVVNSLLQSLLGIANRKGVAGHVFGGSTPGTAPVEVFFGGYRYRGEGSGLLTDLGQGLQIPITIGSPNPIGSTSARVEGTVDLDPALTAGTQIAELAGARGLGVTLGRIEFSFDGGPRGSVDLTGATSISEVVTRLENAIRDYETEYSVTVLGPGGVSFNGGSLTIDVVAGPPDPPLEFFDVGTATTALDLGLTAPTPFAFAAGSPAGLELGPALTWTSPISALRGVTGPLGSIRINNLGQSRIVDLSGAQTLEDIRNLIEGAGLGVRVEINADRTGINVVNEVAAGSQQAMSIEEVAGGNLTATRLGIRSLSAVTRVADFNGGRGVQIAHGGVDPQSGLPDPARDVDFEITLGSTPPTTFSVDLRPEDLATVQTVIDRINEQAQAAGVNVPADFEAALSDGANGIVLRQNAAYTGAISLEARNGSLAAEGLGLLDGTYDPTTSSLTGTDRAKVRVDNLFTHLIDLREALLNDDTFGITLAGEKIEGFVDRIAQTRALVGGYAQRVADGIRRQEDQVLLDERTRGVLRDLDYTEAAVRLSMLQTQLQAGLQTTAASFTRTLLDFLG